jgi:hypothetical protein
MISLSALLSHQTADEIFAARLPATREQSTVVTGIQRTGQTQKQKMVPKCNKKQAPGGTDKSWV